MCLNSFLLYFIYKILRNMYKYEPDDPVRMQFSHSATKLQHFDNVAKKCCKMFLVRPPLVKSDFRCLRTFTTLAAG